LLYHIVKKRIIRLELKFAKAFTRPINVIDYREFDSSLKIDKNIAVRTNFYS